MQTNMMISSCISNSSLLLSLLLLLSRAIRADPPYNNCSSTYNYLANSTFNLDLENLLTSLVSNASLLYFTQTSIEDRVYGNFLCYRTSNTDCHSCVSDAVRDIKRLCPTYMEAIVWEEYCQLRYSNQSFFGVMDYTIDLPLYNKQNYSKPDIYRVVVKGLLGNISALAAFNPSSDGFALGQQQNFMNKDTVYGLVQCTRDLSGNDCNTCLQNAIAHIQNCCYFYMGARVYSTSCFLRYELYSWVKAAASTPPADSDTLTKSKKRKISISVIIIIIAALVSAVALLCCCAYFWLERKRANKEITRSITTEISLHDVVSRTSKNYLQLYMQHQGDEIKAPLINLATIHDITNHFSDSNIIGKGGFGPVYKGVLQDGREVAIKRLSLVSEQGSEEFTNEILLIMKLQHKNLVKLHGCCSEKEEMILVYEYMPRGSLDAYIFDPKGRGQLEWRKRFNIITGIARGLLYLHQDSRLGIIHRDLKPSNVLLDDDMNPKISDFGMARIFGGIAGEASTTAIIVGTYGYMAPEYAMEGLYSIKSDVFSFGVLLIEIVTGKRNARFHLSRLAPTLLAYAWHLWNEGKELELLDPMLTESCLTSEFLRCIHIGLLCVQQDAPQRPNMSSVVVMLENESVPLPQPQSPAFSVVAPCHQILDCSLNLLTMSTISPR